MACKCVFAAMMISILSLQMARVDAVDAKCPGNSPAYTYCAAQGGLCYVPGTLKQGYISYGGGDRWLLLPFTNDRTDGLSLKYRCNEDVGDSRYGSSKWCCYTNTNTDTGFDSIGYQGYVNHGGTLTHSALASQRYGWQQQYVYRPVAGTNFDCNQYNFGDPAVGYTKHCEWKSPAPAALADLAESDWVPCGQHGDNCYNLDTSATQWMRYGDNGKWYYQLVIATGGYFSCNEFAFSDPWYGHAKRCERAPATYTFDGLAGDWKLAKTCVGCTQALTVTEGITQLTEHEVTESWGISITASAEKEFAFGSASLSVTASYDTAHRTMTQDTRHLETSTTITCTNGYLWQWSNGGSSSNGISSKAFEWKSDSYVCSDSGAKPQCPPSYCAVGDIRCQEPCRTDDWRASAVPPMYLLRLPQPDVPAPEVAPPPDADEPVNDAPNTKLPSPSSPSSSWLWLCLVAVVGIALCLNNTALLLCCSAWRQNGNAYARAKYSKVVSLAEHDDQDMEI